MQLFVSGIHLEQQQQQQQAEAGLQKSKNLHKALMKHFAIAMATLRTKTNSTSPS